MSRATGRKLSGKQPTSLEALWDALLSRQKRRILAAYGSLDDAEKKAVLLHLRRMADEAGWLPEQRASARVALLALENLDRE